MPRLAFEDFRPGDRLAYEPFSVTSAEIVAFASRYDPQPFHLDQKAARETIAGGLIASGWHTCALFMRAMTRAFILDATSAGAPGIEEVRWAAPVRPGVMLHGAHEVLETRASRSRPDLGLVRFRFTLDEADGTRVLEQTNWIFFRRRDAEPVASTARPAEAPLVSAPSLPAPRPLAFHDDLAIGETTFLGAHRFTAEEIVAFAEAFDPQPFHLDEAAAAKTHFGGLSASGWHTAARWMKAMVGHVERATRAAAEAGVPSAKLGPSPGFTNLVWSRPVRTGDTISYLSTVTKTRPLRSRPGWGIVHHRNEGVNQNGETVFAFDGCVLWEGRPG